MQVKTYQNEQVLVVDDDDLLRETVATMLGVLGYRAITAADAYQALELYRQHCCAVVLLDVSLSGMDGRSCLRALREMDREARVILSSGYLPEDEVMQGNVAEEALFLQKPYGPEALHEVLQQVLYSS